MNILLLVLDTARRDAFEPYGAPAGSTPALAQLADAGVLAERAYATASWTLPSHASMFTGLLPRRIGLAQPPAGTPQSARPMLEQRSNRMLPVVLRSAGYATEGWSTNLWASHHAGFDIGFDRFTYVGGERTDRINDLLGQGRRAKLAWAREGLRASADDGSAEAVSDLRASIERWSGTPTFWFANLSECHSPYLPPRPWNDLAAVERVRAALDSQRHLNFLAICLYAAGRHHIGADSFERMHHLYCRSASYVDHLTASVLESLDARGILEQTLVIVTSDHGENFGEGGLIAHGFSVDERLVHVPLLLMGPGADQVDPDEVFSLGSLPRIVAQAAGLRDHPYLAELPEGMAIAQYDPMASLDDERVQSFMHTYNVPEADATRVSTGFTCVTDGHLKLTISDDGEQLYDLDRDPEETAPLDPSHASLDADALRRALEDPANGVALSSPPASSTPPAASPEELAAIEQQMKLLGYM